MQQMGSLQTALQPEVTAPPEDATLQFQREIGKISRQSAVFFIGTSFTMVGGYFFKVYTARVLGAEGLGLYALGMSAVSFFSLFVTFGIPRAMVRFVPSYLAKGHLNQLRALIWRGTLIVFGASLGLGGSMFFARNFIADRIFHNFHLAQILSLMAGMVPLGSVGFLLEQIITGFQKTAHAKSIGSFFVFPLMVALTVTFFSLDWGLRGYIVASLLSSGIGLIVLAVVAWRLVPQHARTIAFTHQPVDMAVLSYAGSMIGLSVLGFLSGQGDKIILGIHLSPRSVGVYSVAGTAAGFVPILLRSANPVFAPFIASLHAGAQRALLEQLFQTLTKWILGMTLPLFGVITLFAPEFMRIFGGDFEAGWTVLVVSALGQLINVAVGSVGYMLMMSGHERLVVKTQVVSSIATFGLYVLLIPAMGVLGAAVAGAVGLVVANLLNLSHVHRVLGMSPYNRRFLRLIPPVLLSASALLLLRTIGLGRLSEVTVILAATLLAYGVFLISILAVGLDETDRLVLGAVWQRLGLPGRGIMGDGAG